jgi:L-seryl-tRNA(Ser) seleniumtransferase
MLSMSLAEANERASALAERIRATCPDAFEVTVVESVSRAGGGALPMDDIPTMVVALAPRDGSVVELERQLRLGEPHVIARISEDRLLLDPRTLTDADEDEVAAALARTRG